MEKHDDDHTRQLRSDVADINAHLDLADITVTPSGPKVDLSDRQLRRIFTQGSFKSGGRLFGGFWQPMSKDERKSLRIEGEPVVEVDYGQIMPRIFYALLGVDPDMEDLYAIPGFEQHRDGIKKVVCSMMFSPHRLERFPRGVRRFFPKSVKIEDVVSAIEAAHPAIRDAFCSGIGHRCQFMESEIMMSVLDDLASERVTALPIHDAVLVPASAADTAQQVMLDVFKTKTGFEGVVEVV